MAKPETKKGEPLPMPCICGRGGITVKSRAGKMITCPDPVNCPGNMRTMWYGNEESAIVEWNGLVATHKTDRRMI